MDMQKDKLEDESTQAILERYGRSSSQSNRNISVNWWL